MYPPKHFAIVPAHLLPPLLSLTARHHLLQLFHFSLATSVMTVHALWGEMRLQLKAVLG